MPITNGNMIKHLELLIVKTLTFFFKYLIFCDGVESWSSPLHLSRACTCITPSCGWGLLYKIVTKYCTSHRPGTGKESFSKSCSATFEIYEWYNFKNLLLWSKIQWPWQMKDCLVLYPLLKYISLSGDFSFKFPIISCRYLAQALSSIHTRISPMKISHKPLLQHKHQELPCQ